MTFPEIIDLLSTQFGSDIQANTQNLQPYLTVPASQLVTICQFLRDDDRLFFDLLACVTGIDNGPDANTMEVIYNLTSIPYEHDLMLKVVIPRTTNSTGLPLVPTVSHIWRTADWHERETFDLLGIQFENHPDLRRILLPTDWVGYPLRTDYQEQEQYHGIKTK
ncbi:NADH-quinone oxidoreductase subunit C [Spirosoma sp. KCTC 42546]|uniref:NADH-quinone oxidoreductase subunit C n=1 Tax=Spirosoma sp. KCTC 42546 TaxID=2520506 RepID=UPI001158C7A4|nr:NADH-quinone oxidoreductase subunit C [Spirosoma sp. KCTC 42546]QDK82964.1 NADH-quinone oxidoreductase subunit C [Spirosoma sp. KCTC 42546]